MTKIDVREIAKQIDEKRVPENRKQIEEFIGSIQGQTMSPGEIIQNVIGPLIGMVNSANKLFTIELVQKVVDELEKEDSK